MEPPFKFKHPPPHLGTQNICISLQCTRLLKTSLFYRKISHDRTRALKLIKSPSTTGTKVTEKCCNTMQRCIFFFNFPPVLNPHIGEPHMSQKYIAKGSNQIKKTRRKSKQVCKTYGRKALGGNSWGSHSGNMVRYVCARIPRGISNEPPSPPPPPQ